MSDLDCRIWGIHVEMTQEELGDLAEIAGLTSTSTSFAGPRAILNSINLAFKLGAEKARAAMREQAKGDPRFDTIREVGSIRAQRAEIKVVLELMPLPEEEGKRKRHGNVMMILERKLDVRKRQVFHIMYGKKGTEKELSPTIIAHRLGWPSSTVKDVQKSILASYREIEETLILESRAEEFCDKILGPEGGE